ncbi:MAG TPA: thiol-disulfide oxidoreductase [Elusimicrobia bacterium]|nr:thiol-disulfide oxidoreductase [Elusimicrobiota bacterium]
MKRSKNVLVAAGLFALALLVWGLLSPSPGLAPGSAAPEFRLADIRGRPASLSDYRGRVVLIDFWATWCDLCQEDFPVLKALYGKFRGERFELLALSVDEGPAEEVAAFAQEAGLPYPVLLADFETARAYRVSGIPMKFLLDQNGIIFKKYAGESDPAELESDIQTLIGRQP